MTPSFNITDWQLFVYVLFSLLILFSAWQGWLHGLGRSLLILIGVGVGYLAGKALGFLIFNLYESLIPLPLPLVKLCANLIFAVLVYLLFVAASIFMFKSTRKQTTLKGKLISGIGGVVFGICNGLVAAIAIAIVIRLVGISNLPIPPEPGSVEFRQMQDVYLPEHQKQSSKMSVNLYRAILHPPMEKWVKLGDPVPESYYKLMVNLKAFSQREDLLKRFIESEEIQALLETPEIAVVLENSSVPQLLKQGKFFEIVRDEDFRELFERKASAEVLAKVDWNAITSRIIENSDLANHPDL